MNGWGCLPSSDFFGFCTELLEKYRNDERIGHVSCGRILRSNPPDGEASYTFNHVPDLSFYATWRRVWHEFDTRLKTFCAFKKSKLFQTLPAYSEFTPYWSVASSGNQLPAAAQYEYILLADNRLCIVPTVPLVEYPGRHRADGLGPVIHPRFIAENTEIDLHARALQLGIPYKRPFDSEGSAFLENRLAALTKIAARNMKIPKVIHPCLRLSERNSGKPAYVGRNVEKAPPRLGTTLLGPAADGGVRAYVLPRFRTVLSGIPP